jgi:hypothetical protein
MYRPGVALALAATLILAGCGAGRTDAPPAASAAPAPTRTVPPATLSPATTLASRLPRLLGIVDGYHMFEVSPQQYEIISRNVVRVLGREGLFDQGVRFGANYDRDKDLHFVLIDPGRSGRSARQILDRLLGS